MNIYEKMLLISSELSDVEKTTMLPVNRSGKEKPVFGEQDVLRSVKPLLLKYKVYGYPASRHILETKTLTNGETQYNFMRVETTYRFVNVEKPEEFIEVQSYGDGIDTGDKAPGKALTYSDKYALMKAFQIVTGDDPDQEPSVEFTRPNYNHPKQEATTIQPASNKQKELIGKLLLERQADIRDFGFGSIDSMNSKQASDVLDKLFKMPKPKKEEPEYPTRPLDDDLPF